MLMFLTNGAVESNRPLLLEEGKDHPHTNAIESLHRHEDAFQVVTKRLQEHNTELRRGNMSPRICIALITCSIIARMAHRSGIVPSYPISSMNWAFYNHGALSGYSTMDVTRSLNKAAMPINVRTGSVFTTLSHGAYGTALEVLSKTGPHISTVPLALLLDAIESPESRVRMKVMDRTVTYLEAIMARRTRMVL